MVGDRYELGERLGRGGFGSVFRARDRELDRVVAIKLLHDRSPTPDLRARFEREARLTAALRHPGIVEVYDFGFTAEGHPFIVYRLVEGSSLAEGAAGRSPEERLDLLAPVAEALDVAHAAGVIHRDVKPANILVGAGGRGVLCDFGIARVSAGRTVVTQEGLVLGTPGYLAPELWRGEAPSPGSDQFALAATAVELLTGEEAFPGGSPMEILRAIERGWVWRGGRPLPAETRAALGRALAPDPAARFPSCASFLGDLRASLRGPRGVDPSRPVASTRRVMAAGAPALARPTPTPRALRSRRRRGNLGAVAALVGAGLLVGWMSRGAPRPLAAPAPAPSPVAVPALAAELAAAVDAVRGLYPPRSDDTWSHEIVSGSEIRSYLSGTRSPELPDRWRGMLRGLERWAAQAARAGVEVVVPDAVLAAVDLTRDLLHHLWELEGLLGRFWKLPGELGQDERNFLEDRIRGLRGSVLEYLGDAVTRHGDLPGVVAVEVLGAALLAGHPDRGSLLDAALGRLERDPVETWRAGSLRNFLGVVRRFRDRPGLTCSARFGIAARFLALAIRPATGAAVARPAERFLEVGDALHFAILTIDGCPDTPARGLLEVIDRAAETLEAGILRAGARLAADDDLQALRNRLEGTAARRASAQIPGGGRTRIERLLAGLREARPAPTREDMARIEAGLGEAVDAVLDLYGLDRAAEGRVRLSFGSLVREYLPGTRSAGLPVRWETLLRTLEEWARSTAGRGRGRPGAPTPSPVRDAVEVARNILHHLWEIEGLLLRPWDSRAGFSQEVEVELQGRAGELRASAEDILAGVFLLRDDLPGGFVVDLGGILLLAGHADRPAVLGGVLDRLERDPPGPRRPMVLYEFLRILRRFRHHGEFSCPARLEAAVRYLALARPSAVPDATRGPASRFLDLGDALNFALMVLERCDPRPGDGVAEALDQTVTTLEEGVRRHHAALGTDPNLGNLASRLDGLARDPMGGHVPGGGRERLRRLRASLP